MYSSYKQTVEGAISEFVQALVTEFATKVTSMLIEMPVKEIKKYLVNFDLFHFQVFKANQLLQQQDVGIEQQH
jgi:hypothetical protein